MTDSKVSLARGKTFYEKNFPGTSPSDWNSWQWQLKNAFRSQEQIEKIISLSTGERDYFQQKKKSFPVRITPYYASLLCENTSPLRRTVLPDLRETLFLPSEVADPLTEEKLSPVPAIIHRYPDRVVFVTTFQCATYCRYCTRKRVVGRKKYSNDRQEWQKGVDYIRANSGITDVLISGGDPLILDDESLAWLLSRIREIPHVKLIRIGTKTPVNLPQRFQQSLIDILKKYAPLIISLHVTHVSELTPEMSAVCEQLVENGILIGSQTVLLKGINDSVEQIRELMLRLLWLRVRPYYLLHCDAVQGSGQFRTSIQKGLDLIEGLRGEVSGYAIPQFVVDPIGGGGKIVLHPENIVRHEADGVWLKNWQGQQVFVAEPDSTTL